MNLKNIISSFEKNFNWKVGNLVAAVLFLLFSWQALSARGEVVDKYQAYINGSQKYIMVEYTKKIGITEYTSFYTVPTLDRTPEYHNWQNWLMLSILALSHAVPSPKKELITLK